MYTRAALLDVHRRAHQSLRLLLEHCRGLEAGALNRELPGFGYPTVRLQLHHVIGAEEYWTGVLEGKMLVDENDADYPAIESLERYREQVAQTTEALLQRSADPELNTAREVVTWQGKRRVLAPAHVVMRQATHIYHHQGQVLAMCRILELPHPGGLDFPLD